MSEEPHPACLSSHIEFDKLDRFKTYATETYSYDVDGNRISLKLVGRKSETPSDAWMAANQGIGLVRRPTQPAIVGLNLYGYVGGNPVTGRDPLGLCPMCLIPALPYVAEAAIVIGVAVGIIQQSRTPNSGTPGDWVTNPGNGQERLFGNDGKPAVDIDWHPDHGAGTPHGHNWDRDSDGRPVRGPGVPLSPWPRDRKPSACNQ